MVTDLQAASAKLSALFSDPVKIVPTKRDGKPALLIKREAMYSVPEWQGKGGLIGMLHAFQDATGCNMVDEYETQKISGCETCDYGSLYGISYIAWEE